MSEEFVSCEENQTEAKDSEQKYFKIAEASNLLGIKPHVLRYWETEFPQIRPCKSKTGQRLYRRRDFEALKQIYKLLYLERCTIARARQILRQMYENEAPLTEEPREDISETEIMANENEPTTDGLAITLVPEMRVELPVYPIFSTASRNETHDVLEIVEEKMMQSQICKSLERAQIHLRGILLALEA